MADKQTTGFDWHAHGMAWALADSMQPGGAEEWTAADLARAYEAGAKHAQQMDRKRLRGLLMDCQRHLACNAITADLQELYQRVRAEVERPE